MCVCVCARAFVCVRAFVRARASVYVYACVFVCMCAIAFLSVLIYSVKDKKKHVGPHTRVLSQTVLKNTNLTLHAFICTAGYGVLMLVLSGMSSREVSLHSSGNLEFIFFILHSLQ